MAEKDKILFIYPKKASFIRLDIAILSERYEVIENTYNWKNKKAVPFFFAMQFFFILKHVISVKGVLISFGGYWCLMPILLGKIFRKPVFIILNGTDCASFPEINYGNISKPMLRKVLKTSYRYASQLLPVSESLVYTENNYYDPGKTIKQGYKHFFPEIETDYTVIFNAIDTEFWQIDPSQERQKNKFLTVLSEGQFIRKGGEIIIAVASRLPQFEFYFVGIKQPQHLADLPSNVTFIARTKPEGLKNIYNTSRFYLQLSNYEGFGVALGEAMASGCIPIVSDVNFMPGIIGDTGYVLGKRDGNMLIALLMQAFEDSNEHLSEKARKRIIDHFSIQQRKDKLFETLNIKSQAAASQI